MSASSPRIPVAIELVLAIDNSSSVDSREYELQRQGIAKAFADPDVIGAITSLNGGVAVALFQWGEKARSRMVLPFTHINNQRNAKAFSFRVAVLPRARPSAYTALGHAIIASANYLKKMALTARDGLFIFRVTGAIIMASRLKQRARVSWHWALLSTVYQ